MFTAMPGTAARPAPRSVFAQLEPLLAQVAKPIQYVGGELNSTVKEWDDVAVRWALMYPDAYPAPVAAPPRPPVVHVVADRVAPPDPDGASDLCAHLSHRWVTPISATPTAALQLLPHPGRRTQPATVRRHVLRPQVARHVPRVRDPRPVHARRAQSRWRSCGHSAVHGRRGPVHAAISCPCSSLGTPWSLSSRARMRHWRKRGAATCS
jgi:hypothetical protein